MSYCPTCCARLCAWPGEPVACQHPGTDALPSRVIAADSPPPEAAELAARRAARIEGAAGHEPPPEQVELRKLLGPSDLLVARAAAELAAALAVEHEVGE